MAFEKILILESSWAEQEEHYISDSRSTSRIYGGFEAVLSVHDKPVFTVVRPLLKSRYLSDIEQFITLQANRKGPNIIILSAHGRHELVKKRDKRKHRRILEAIDGKINLSKGIRKLSSQLNRTIFLLDACWVGTNVESFRKASGALGVIGYSEEVDWVDSSAFILALLMNYQKGGIFQMQRVSPVKPQKVLGRMRNGAYKSLMEELGVEYNFRAI